MKASTLEVIGNVLSADDTVTAEQRDVILRSCRQNVPKRKLIGAKAAMEILGISRPTLRSYVANGQLEQVNFSSRRVRFDEAAIQQLAYAGVQESDGGDPQKIG